MKKEREYAYMVGDKMGIMYHLGKYCVVSVLRKDNGMMAYTHRQFKTISGAERFLLKDYSYAGRNAPEIKYGTKKFIEEGSYWK